MKSYGVIKYLLFVIIAGMSSCGVDRAADTVMGEVDQKSRYFSFDVRIGNEYFLKRFGFLRGNHVPQVVIWAEDANGKYLSTVYMTRRAAEGDWGTGEVLRPTCFPVWAMRRRVETLPDYFMPTRAKPLVDGITSATPHGNFKVVRAVPESFITDTVTIYVEVNMSYDHNEKYPEKDGKFIREYSYNGQPSIVWSGTLAMDKKGKTEVALAIVGYGSVDGSDGELYRDLEGVTTALELLKSITVTYQP